MALKPVYPKPTPELPSWAKNSNAVKEFQDAAIAKGYKFKGWTDKNKPGYGSFGPQTNKAWESNLDIARPQESIIATTPRGMETAMSKISMGVGSPLGKSAVLTGAVPANKNGLLTALEGVAPFASNIANMTRKPPMPIRGGSIDPVTLRKADFSNERNEFDRQARGADLNADRTLDGNTSAAVRTANLIQKQRGVSESYSREENTNSQIANQQALINSQIAEKNTRTNDGYNQQQIERQIAQQNAASANIANASDKFVAMSNEKSKRELDGKNFALISQLYKNSGVLDRVEANLKASGIDDISNTQGKKVKTFRKGGRLKKAY